MTLRFLGILLSLSLAGVACSKHNDPPTPAVKAAGGGDSGKGQGGGAGNAVKNPVQIKMSSRPLAIGDVTINDIRWPAKISLDGQKINQMRLDLFVEVLPHQIPLNLTRMPMEYCTSVPVRDWSTSLRTVCQTVTSGMEDVRILGVEATVKDVVKIATVLRLDGREIKRKFVADLEVRICADKKDDEENARVRIQYNPQKVLLDFSRQFTQNGAYNSVSNGHYSGARTYDTRCGTKLSNIRTESGSVVGVPADTSVSEPKDSRKLGLEIGSVDTVIQEKLSKLIATIDQIPFNVNLLYWPQGKDRNILELFPSSGTVLEKESAQLGMTPIGSTERLDFRSVPFGTSADFEFENRSSWSKY